MRNADKNIRAAYCTGFWCTNIGNGFFSLGVEYALKKILGQNNVTVVSDLQTYTTSYGRRLYLHKNQYDLISKLEVDYVVLAGPVLSRYFLTLWKDCLLQLKSRGVGYILLSAGCMKLDEGSRAELEQFFRECPPFILCSRETSTFDMFGKYARHAYDGVCFSFFAPDYYAPCGIAEPYMVCNFDKIQEPVICDDGSRPHTHAFRMADKELYVNSPDTVSSKTDRFTDALIYARSLLPAPKRPDEINGLKVVRTDQRFHPHFRTKIYRHSNSFCADIPYGYLNIYANSQLTLSDRIHACAVTMAFGNPAMLFVKTNRVGLLERVGAGNITKEPVTLDLEKLTDEKERMLNWIGGVLAAERENKQ